ncbi:MAG: hypothetical protein VB021_09705 [Oscillospiraceae bacterium]|nr:hypothetical protein [Oscillospiraceae bacterium]
MKTESQLTQAYEGGRKSLLLMTIFTAVNVVLVLLKADLWFLFTAFFPYVAAASSAYGFLGMPQVSCILLCCVLPVLLWALCWHLSGDGHGVWLKVAAAAFGLDTVFLLFFMFTVSFDTSFAFAIGFHALVLWELIRAAVAGRHLERQEYAPDTAPAAIRAVDDGLFGAPPQSAAAQDASAAPAREYGAQTGRIYTYDRTYAKQNHADKTLPLILTGLGCIVGFLAVITATIYLSIDVFKMSDNGSMIFIFSVFALLIALIIFIVTRFNPFTQARLFSYTAGELGGLRRCSALQPAAGMSMGDLRVEAERPDRWVVSYARGAGKRARAVIPKAYPGLEEYMAGTAVGQL